MNYTEKYIHSDLGVKYRSLGCYSMVDIYVINYYCPIKFFWSIKN